MSDLSSNSNDTRCQKIRVAVIYRVCQGWRLPIFQRLAGYKGISLRVFHGQTIQSTKLINASDFRDLEHQELRTFSQVVRSTGRDAYLLIYPSVMRHLTNYKPDVLLCEGGSNILNNLLVYAWAKVHRVPTIWWDLGEIPGRRYSGISLVYRWFRLRLMRQSTVLLGYSSRAVAYFRRERLKQPIFRAVNCVDTDRVFSEIAHAQEVRPPLRIRMGLEDKRILLFVGAIETPKRLDVLLQAYKSVRDRLEGVALIIVGDGSALGSVRAQSDDLALPDVYFTGRVIEGVSEYFLAADLFVLPGLGGLAISEAMAHGLPVICTTADGCEIDLVKPGENGFILPEGDPVTLAQVIEDIVMDTEGCERMGRRSREIIMHEHNVHTYLQGIVDAIRCAYELGSGRRNGNTSECSGAG